MTMTDFCDQDGVLFICGFEEFKAYPYLDGGGLPTIGYGSRIASMDLYPSGITHQGALDLMAAHLAVECAALAGIPELNNLLKTQKNAVTSLGYNIGVEAFLESTVCTRIKLRNPDITPWNWFVYDALKNKEPGLVIRRAKEQRLFVYGEY